MLTCFNCTFCDFANKKYTLLSCTWRLSTLKYLKRMAWTAHIIHSKGGYKEPLGKRSWLTALLWKLWFPKRNIHCLLIMHWIYLWPCELGSHTGDICILFHCVPKKYGSSSAVSELLDSHTEDICNELHCVLNQYGYSGCPFQ